MRRPHLFAVVLAGMLVVPAAASAAPCAGQARDAQAVVDAVRASCDVRAGERAAFRWLPVLDGHAVADVEGTAFDAVVDVYRESRDGALGERLATWDQGDPRAAEHVAFAVSAEPVLVVVRGYHASSAGRVALLVRRGAPVNATADGAQPVALGPDGTGAAGMNWGLPTLAGAAASGAPSRWFRFVAARTGRMTASTCTPYAGDTQVSAYVVTGGGALELLASNDDTPLRCERAGASYTGFPVEGGREYRVAVRPGAGFGRGPDTLVLGWDDSAPATSLDVGPAGVVAERSAAFAWSSPAADAVGFECSLDGAPFARCAESYGGLDDGEHAFRVRALDAAGNVGAAAERTWRIAPAVAAAASSRSSRVVVETRRVSGPRSARARGLARAFEGAVRARFVAGRAGTRVLLLSLRSPRPGTLVEVRCARRGNGCPFVSRRGVSPGADLASLFRGRRLSTGAVVELRVTRPGTMARILRWEVRSGLRPRATSLCVAPGTSRAAPC